MKIENIIFEPPNKARVLMSDGSYLANVRSVWVSGELGQPTVVKVEVILTRDKTAEVKRGAPVTVYAPDVRVTGVPPKK